LGLEGFQAINEISGNLPRVSCRVPYRLDNTSDRPIYRVHFPIYVVPRNNSRDLGVGADVSYGAGGSRHRSLFGCWDRSSATGECHTGHSGCNAAAEGADCFANCATRRAEAGDTSGLSGAL
jgi:hypothetical protein